DAEADEDVDEAADLLEVQHVLARQPRVVVLRHAVFAAEVAAVGDRQAQVPQRTAEAIGEHDPIVTAVDRCDPIRQTEFVDAVDVVPRSPRPLASAAVSAPARLSSLDAFRGATIAAMVIVNNPGTWTAMYWPLEHAEWDGWTPTDLIFPFFLFIVGVAIPLAFGKRIERGDPRKKLFLKVVYRSVIIFLLGEFLAGFPYFHLSTIRIPGVLQRIAVCYFFAGLIYLLTRARTTAIIAVALLVIYHFLMTRGHAPGHYVGDLSKEGSLASYIDRTVFGPHVWRQAVVYDPEGILSTMGALATTLFGVLTGYLIRDKNKTPIEKVALMMVAGFA